MDDASPRDALEDLGLSKYAAETLIGLQKVGPATARDIAAVTDVPRSQVYGATEELEHLGLVNTQDTNPKEFAAVQPIAVGDILQARMHRQTDTAVNYLQELRSSGDQPPAETEHMWRIHGVASITQRVLALVEAADTRVQYYVSAADYLPSDLSATFETLADRGVDVQLSAASDAPVTESALDVDTSPVTFAHVESLPLVTSRCTRLLLVDDDAVLVGIATGPTPNDELCFWSTSEQIAPLLAGAFDALVATATDSA